jgi:hypothetical protein
VGEIERSIKVSLARLRAQAARLAEEQYGEAAQQSDPESEDGYASWASRAAAILSPRSGGATAEDTPSRLHPRRQRTQADRFSPEPFFQGGGSKREYEKFGEAQIPSEEENTKRSTRSARPRGEKQPGFFDAPFQDPEAVVPTQDDDDPALDESGIKVLPPLPRLFIPP